MKIEFSLKDRNGLEKARDELAILFRGQKEGDPVDIADYMIDRISAIVRQKTLDDLEKRLAPHGKLRIEPLPNGDWLIIADKFTVRRPTLKLCFDYMTEAKDTKGSEG